MLRQTPIRPRLIRRNRRIPSPPLVQAVQRLLRIIQRQPRRFRPAIIRPGRHRQRRPLERQHIQRMVIVRCRKEDARRRRRNQQQLGETRDCHCENERTGTSTTPGYRQGYIYARGGGAGGRSGRYRRPPVRVRDALIYIPASDPSSGRCAYTRCVTRCNL